jgi:fumarate hydratase class I
MCQDTGTAIIMGKKGRLVFTDGDDEGALAEGARDAYLKKNLRYSQLAPVSMFVEKNTANNMPAQVEIYAEGGRRATRCCSSPRAAARPTRRSCSRRRRRS